VNVCTIIGPFALGSSISTHDLSSFCVQVSAGFGVVLAWVSQQQAQLVYARATRHFPFPRPQEKEGT
jgi:hypothetical protein